jgi:hypothetical protein
LDELNKTNEMEAHERYSLEEGAIELVQPPTRNYHIRLYEGAFDRIEEVVLDSDALRPLFVEYDRAIRELVQLHGNSATRGFETLDYAKKVVHDDAADFLVDELKGCVSLNQADAKRLFTLLFLIESDLPEKMVQYHKFHL